MSRATYIVMSIAFYFGLMGGYFLGFNDANKNINHMLEHTKDLPRHD